MDFLLLVKFKLNQFSYIFIIISKGGIYEMMKAKYDFKKNKNNRGSRKYIKHPKKVLPGDLLYCNHSKHPKLM